MADHSWKKGEITIDYFSEIYQNFSIAKDNYTPVIIFTKLQNILFCIIEMSFCNGGG